ncbi:DUF4185 domain-containing protein [Actinotalea sp. BY-33]|uniref:DUF4185 domain-containing protein n=1 Tax=Actinotalea soli TaxID=2819234 RepID=A0A939LPQ0_9CELL|nr:DUF4185 domain-containing protein [Actinotalea soli]MBO1752136.1 DUF4185 domain-containing protein [Actinotalea soli]
MRAVRGSTIAGLVLALGTTLGGAAPGAPQGAGTPEGHPAPSTWGGTVEMDPDVRHTSASDGDLWPSCWADDGNLYSAWGDGKGFDLAGPFTDIGVARLSGPADDIQGVNLAVGDEVGQVWSGPGHTRKPTGMVCVEDTIHLAVQDLAWNFDAAPAATIATSTDGGETWTWDTSGPMFDDGVFTTMWFADHGQGGEWSEDGYVYVYGIDQNWRDSFSGRVEDPTSVYLARVPQDKVGDRSRWRFYAGTAGTKGKPKWSKKVGDREPVLHDERRVYPDVFEPWMAHDMTTLSQGHVLYNEPLDRYLYSSWTEFTLHLYDSPTPWGPWTRLSDHDFGAYPWTGEQYAGYGATLPSKFLSEDGRTMMLQANVCPCAPTGGVSVYNYAVRQLTLAPSTDTPAANALGDENLAMGHGAVAISKSVNQGSLDALNDGATDVSLDDSDEELKRDSWWGYTWPQDMNLNRVQYTTGEVGDLGGWFLNEPRVQVRRDGTWTEVAGQKISPRFVNGKAGGSFQTYTVSFPPVVADGVRVIGTPGGDRTFSSMAEMSAHYDLQVVDGGFEETWSLEVSPWDFEGDSPRGLDDGGAFARTGEKNAWVRTFDPIGAQAITQRVAVTPGSTVTISSWSRTSPAVSTVRVGARWEGGEQIETFAGSADYAERAVTVTVPAGVSELTLLVGYEAEGGDAVLQVDDISLTAE